MRQRPEACTPDCTWPRCTCGLDAETTASALARQEGGGHYKGMAIQPFEYIHKNGIAFAEGCVIKYVSRWRAKGGIEDLKKARHFLDLLIEAEGGK
jgi:Protein of unknwon function (DUF3310)